ncbi:hypothetical protein I6G56_22885 [Burkholderia humptydooensis]|uniref:Uncharacterized protein n=2 Tax=Burkholderia humptydooensis TaxID=430531 RepID=A0A7U4SUF1_9BURK|nr:MULTISPECIES: hypothetical protein [Burkholderia]AJY38610.1 secreted repeat of unknown function family protein [Burkholderia sp. 2002721687]ALX45801.1 hypothetical protein AQ610_25585 [Burkholderia humptydooensis]EIP86779.1 hypothetical protein A33K_16382 [Burkholderia humptydooensis MSMB43]QPS47293.1 hypothetical protein I6G56_22885 [Burkholderia humptydooensis]
MIKILLIAIACAVPAAALAEPPKESNGMVVDDDGMTLYTFDRDTMPGQSACKGGCTANWPAALADAYDRPGGGLGFIAAAGGKRQWTYKGHPLYRFSGDTKPGQHNGDGFGGMWHVARP